MINEAIKVIDFLKKRPMLFLAVISALSVLLIYYSFFTAIIFAALYIVVMFALNYKKQSGVLILCVTLLLITMLSAARTMNSIDRCEKLDGMTVSGEFLAVTVSENKTDRYLCEVEVLECEYLKRGDKLQVFYNGTKIEMGQSFKARAELSKITGEISVKSYHSEGIYLFGDLSGIVLTHNTDFVLNTINGIRTFIKNEIFKYFDENEAATMLALLTGDRTYLSDSFYGNIKSAGVIHVMVVSGMHLSIIVSFMLFAVNKFMYNRYLKAVVIFLTVLAVAAVCGFTMSIQRAGITYILVALALFIGRQAKAENSLGAAVSLVILLNPLAIFSVAFQLSVLSTFGILAIALPVTEFLSKKEIINNKWVLSFISAVLITLSALLLTLPVTISVFGYVSNMSLVTNLLISFAVTLALSFCISGFIFFPLRSIAFYIAAFIVKYVNAVINYFGGVQFAVTYLPEWLAYLSAAIIFLILLGLVACAKQDNMLKLKGVINKKIKEGGAKLKWPFLKKKR